MFCCVGFCWTGWFLFVPGVGVLVTTIVTSIVSGMGAVTCDMLYISVIVLCRFRFAAAVLIVDPIFVVVCRALGGGDGIFGVVVVGDVVNLMSFLIVGGYSGGAFLFRSFGFGSGGDGLWIPRNLSSVLFWGEWLVPQCLECLLLPL